MSLPVRGTETLARAAIVAILVLLGVLAVSAAVESRRSAVRLEHQAALLGAYLTVHRSVAEMRGVEHAYEVRGTGDRRRFDSARASLTAELAALERQGDASDRAQVEAVRRVSGPYVAGTSRLFDAHQAGQRERAEHLDGQLVDPAADALEQVVHERGPRYAREAMLASRVLKTSGDRLLQAVVIGIPVGLVALAALWAVLLVYRRRLSEASRHELRRLERAAFEDALTGLGNNRAFHEELQRADAQAERPLSLTLLDLEGLKRVNDTHGLGVGDERIVALARTLAARVEDGCAFRIGGDEFAVVQPRRSAWDAFVWTQDVAAEARGSGVAFCAGVAEIDGDEGRDELLERVDLALVHAKRGNHAVVAYSCDLTTPEEDRAGEGRHAQTLASALAQAVDAKDSYTRSHCETVSETCVLIANELRLDPRRVARLRVAGLLHDVGKIGVPDEILQKPSALTREEVEVMRGHPELGARIARSADLGQEAEWILRHHERIDGAGYPDGLAGGEIPLESRIILVADALEAITSDRPYRRGRSQAEAVEELWRHAGTQFDRGVVAALVRALDRDGELADPAGEEAVDEGHVGWNGGPLDRLGGLSSANGGGVASGAPAHAPTAAR